VKIDNYEEIKASLEDFLRKENSSLDKYDLFTKKIWLTIGKPEPQAREFVRTLKNLIESFSKSNWKILYKIKEQDAI
jgi:hypothetical protein